MSNGASLFVSLAVITVAGGLIYFRVRLAELKQLRNFEPDVDGFDKAVERNDIPEIHRLGLRLVFNAHLTNEVLSRMEKVVEEKEKFYPSLTELKLAIENKRRHWNRPLAY